MIVVTNKIKTKLGFAEKMAPLFTRPGALQEMKGFIKVEVLVTKNIPDYDELNVNMYWEDIEDFRQWRTSNAFKEAHKDSNQPGQESPIIGSEIIMYEVASTLDAASKQ